MIRCFVLAASLTCLFGTAHGQSVDAQHREALQPGGPVAAGKESPDASAVVQSIIDRTNAFRKEEKRSAVKTNAALTKAAEGFAQFMARTGKYGHTADDRQPAERAKAAGYDYCIVLENIAYRYNSAGFSTDELSDGFFSGWKKSPGHRRNMLDPDVTETGVAIAQSAETGYWYAVQMFGRPHSASIKFSITNKADAEVRYAIGDEEFSLPPRYTRTHTRCRPPELVLKSPADLAGATKSAPLRPAAGSKIEITGSKGKYRVAAN